MFKQVKISYGHDTKILRIPSANLAWVASPRHMPPLTDLPEAIRSATRSPIGTPGLPDLVALHGTKTVILADDMTRRTPHAAVLPALLNELNAAGVPDVEITLLIALGTHRPMSEKECLLHYGDEVMSRVRVENLSQDPADFVDLGFTPTGIPIHVSRQYLDSDLSIAVGNIIPHMYAGWSGGAKMVQPGVSSPLTTSYTHLIAGPRIYEILGQVDNPVRREMEQIAIQSGLKFIVNVVLNPGCEVVAVVAGDVVAAHRAGVDIARKIYTVELEEKLDIIVASSHPSDRNLWQGAKPICNCGMMVKDGGTLILLTPAPEGIAPEHPQLVRFGQTPGDEIIALVEREELSNRVNGAGGVDGVAASVYLSLDQTRKRVNIVLVTDGISAEEAAQIGLSSTPDFDAALAAALARHGEKVQIGVVTHGAQTVASFKEQSHSL